MNTPIEIEKVLSQYIDNAFYVAEKSSISRGVDIFFTIRALLKTLQINEKSSMSALNEQRLAYQDEAKIFNRSILHTYNNSKYTEDIFIVGDSLHLPRPAETKQANGGIQHTASFKLIEQIQTNNLNLNVKTWAQRYFTTDSLLRVWNRIIPKNLSNTHLIIHLGLNDHVERIFSEEERLALSICSPTLTQKIVKFGQVYRRVIIQKQNNHSYVPFEQFKKNIQSIIVQSKQKNVKSLSFINIIASNIDSWNKTPRSMWITTKYNMFLYDMEQQHDINVIDLDRQIWELGLHEYLLEDKMHLSQSGHQLLADTILNTIKGKK